MLDLIRGLDVRRADQVLQFTERGIASDVRKVLASAVANAVHNDQQDPDELFVLACFADEGPTLRRFRPRARGRATRIRKRSCHITVIVARMSDERLEVVQAREATVGGRGGRPTSSAASRRARVERSRQRAAAAHDGSTGTAADDSVADDAADADLDDEVDETVADDAAVDADVEVVDAEDAVVADDVDDDVAADEGGVAAGEYPGSALPDDDGNAPEGFEIKGNTQSRFLPHARQLPLTTRPPRPRCTSTPSRAPEAAGFSAPVRARPTRSRRNRRRDRRPGDNPGDTDEKDD